MGLSQAATIAHMPYFRAASAQLPWLRPHAPAQPAVAACRPCPAIFGTSPSSRSNPIARVNDSTPSQAVARHHLDHQCTRRFSHTGELLHSSDSGSLTAAISERGELISLPWHVLQRELAQALPPGVLRTSHRFVSFAETADGVEAEFETADGGRLRVEAGLLIGCDGSQSPVRQQLLGDGAPTFLGEVLIYCLFVPTAHCSHV